MTFDEDFEDGIDDILPSELSCINALGAILETSASMLNMAGNYDERCVNNYDDGVTKVDTARVTDGQKPFETAVSHKDYNNGQWIIVEAYDTVDEAKIGHESWVKTMTAERLPDVLFDCCNAKIAKAALDFGWPSAFPRECPDKDGE